MGLLGRETSLMFDV